MSDLVGFSAGAQPDVERVARALCHRRTGHECAAVHQDGSYELAKCGCGHWDQMKAYAETAIQTMETA